MSSRDVGRRPIPATTGPGADRVASITSETGGTNGRPSGRLLRVKTLSVQPRRHALYGNSSAERFNVLPTRRGRRCLQTPGWRRPFRVGTIFETITTAARAAPVNSHLTRNPEGSRRDGFAKLTRYTCVSHEARVRRPPPSKRGAAPRRDPGVSTPPVEGMPSPATVARGSSPSRCGAGYWSTTAPCEPTIARSGRTGRACWFSPRGDRWLGVRASPSTSRAFRGSGSLVNGVDRFDRRWTGQLIDMADQIATCSRDGCGRELTRVHEAVGIDPEGRLGPLWTCKVHRTELWMRGSAGLVVPLEWWPDRRLGARFEG